MANCTVIENIAGEGGGVFSSATLTVSGSTFSNNSAVYGGGLWNSGNLTVSGSTVSGNSAVVEGGGIWNQGTLWLPVASSGRHHRQRGQRRRR